VLERVRARNASWVVRVVSGVTSSGETAGEIVLLPAVGLILVMEDQVCLFLCQYLLDW
jgi:hypothetical protein